MIKVLGMLLQGTTLNQKTINGDNAEHLSSVLFCCTPSSSCSLGALPGDTMKYSRNLFVSNLYLSSINSQEGVNGGLCKGDARNTFCGSAIQLSALLGTQEYAD